MIFFIGIIFLSKISILFTTPYLLNFSFIFSMLHSKLEDFNNNLEFLHSVNILDHAKIVSSDNLKVI